MNTTTFSIILLFFSFLFSCSDANYHGENYQAFESMDELVLNVVNSIKNQDEDKMLQLLDNETLLFDLLNSTTGNSAEKTKAYLATEEGKRNISRDHLAKKIRINAFFETGLAKQITINKSAFNSSGMELLSDKPFAENSPANLQSYNIALNNGDSKKYTYNIQVIYWNDKFHLIEAAGFLEIS